MSVQTYKPLYSARENGKRKSISESGYRTKAEAEAAGIKAKAEYDNAGRTFTPLQSVLRITLIIGLKTM